MYKYNTSKNSLPYILISLIFYRESSLVTFDYENLFI